MFAFHSVLFILVCLIAIVLGCISVVLYFKTKELKIELKRQRRRIQAFADIYNSMHIIDLEADTVEEFKALDGFNDYAGIHPHATELMRELIKKTTSDAYQEKALAFTDLTTLPERLANCDTLSSEFYGVTRWWRGRFIVIDRNENGRPVNVIWASVIVQDEKKREEGLIHSLYTDTLTHLYNRHAFDDEVKTLEKDKTANLLIVSLDLNGLKRVNDSFGHVFGDELLQGASQCMDEIFSPYGKVFRVGGDEFAALLDISKDQADSLFANFEKTLAAWQGKMVSGISMSYGYVFRSDYPGKTIEELMIIADEKMYSMKKEYYSRPGVDRRKR